MAGTNDNAPSKVELAKLASRGLRGTLPETLASDAPHFQEDDKQLLKFHGVYQQDDRDLRVANKKAGLDKAWSFMIRLNIPGGRLTADQWLELDRLADVYGGGSLRITTRQSIQYHGVLKGDLRTLIAGVNHAALTTIAACGDVQRNVMAVPAPTDDPAHHAVRQLAVDVTNALVPRTAAYHQIWVDGERVEQDAPAEPDPFYGEAYLPRKFKTGIALDTDNAIDVYAYDCGLIGVTEGADVTAWLLVAGGGFGMTHKKPDTIARVASPIGLVPRDRGVDAVRQVAAIFRDHGNRSDRRHARLKYLIEEWGVDRFRRELRARIDWQLADPIDLPHPRQHDYLGPHEQGDGRWFYGVFIQNGRVVDRGRETIRAALREVADRLRPRMILTPMQSVIIGDLAEEQIAELESILRDHGLRTTGALSNARRYSMACPALPTCGLALAESERIFPDVVDRLEAELDRLGLAAVPITIRMTGCPNGCARPYNADIGLVGRKPGVYNVYVGGGLAGDRLADLLAPDVHIDAAVDTLRPLLTRFRDERSDGESLSDFYRRITGRPERRTLLTGDESPTLGLVQVGLPG